MKLNYNKIWSLINGKNYSARKFAEIINMSDTGFTTMMKKETMSVATLEIIVEHFEVRIESLFGDGPIVRIDAVDEPRPDYKTKIDNLDDRLGSLEEKIESLFAYLKIDKALRDANEEKGKI